jgi:hypothetical protein
LQKRMALAGLCLALRRRPARANNMAGSNPTRP